jgi:hypothetical protein
VKNDETYGRMTPEQNEKCAWERKVYEWFEGRKGRPMRVVSGNYSAPPWTITYAEAKE